MEANSTFDTATVFDIVQQIDYAESGIVSKQVLKSQAGNISLFSFDKGQGLSEHSAPYDAFVQVIDGVAEIKIGGATHKVEKGKIIIMPAHIPHALHAVERFKMLLTMIKSKGNE